jgi:hypothetical protein
MKSRSQQKKAIPSNLLYGMTAGLGYLANRATAIVKSQGEPSPNEVDIAKLSHLQCVRFASSEVHKIEI